MANRATFACERKGKDTILVKFEQELPSDRALQLLRFLEEGVFNDATSFEPEPPRESFRERVSFGKHSVVNSKHNRDMMYFVVWLVAVLGIIVAACFRWYSA